MIDFTSTPIILTIMLGAVGVILPVISIIRKERGSSLYGGIAFGALIAAICFVAYQILLKHITPAAIFSKNVLVDDTFGSFFAIAMFSAALASLAPIASAQTYPAKPIRFYTPYPPGGTTDILARLFGAKMYEAWNQPVIVEAKPGAGGNIGADFVAKSAPDGYTILMGASGPLAINASLFSKLPYDPLKDFAPVVLSASVPLMGSLLT